jgi:hypothetical protein
MDTLNLILQYWDQIIDKLGVGNLLQTIYLKLPFEYKNDTDVHTCILYTLFCLQFW